MNIKVLISFQFWLELLHFFFILASKTYLQVCSSSQGNNMQRSCFLNAKKALGMTKIHVGAQSCKRWQKSDATIPTEKALKPNLLL